MYMYMHVSTRILLLHNTIDREMFVIKKKFVNVAIYENLTYENFSPKLTTQKLCKVWQI